MASRIRITWLEEWVAPGVCLLGRTAIRGRSSLGRAEKEVQESGVWACVHEQEMALIDAPFPWEDPDGVLPLIDQFIARHRVALKYITATRLNLERSGGLLRTLNRYKESTFVYPESWPVHWKSLSLDRQQFGFQQGLTKQWDDVRNQPYADALQTQLSGERLFFFDAPYHTLTDQLVIFRGVALLPEWQLPTSMEEPLPTNLAPREAVRDTLNRLSAFETRYRYGVHSAVDVRGKSPVRSDFQRQMVMGYVRMAAGGV